MQTDLMTGDKSFILNNGLRIPAIGYGTYPQKDSLRVSVPVAYRNGFRLFDTSDNYHNEQFLGQGLSEIDDSDTIIVSKFSRPSRTLHLEQCFEESRQKLGGKIDIYLLHWPYPYLWKDQWRTMEQLYLAGKCKAIGVCNFDVKHLTQLLKFCKVKPAINQFERHPILQQNDVFQFCRQNKIAVMSYSPVARMDRTLHENKTIQALAEKYHKTTSQIILRWNVQTNSIPIPASKSELHIKENFNIFDFSLSEEEMNEINTLELGKRIRYDLKSRFSWKTKRKFQIMKLKNTVKNSLLKR